MPRRKRREEFCGTWQISRRLALVTRALGNIRASDSLSSRRHHRLHLRRSGCDRRCAGIVVRAAAGGADGASAERDVEPRHLYDLQRADPFPSCGSFLPTGIITRRIDRKFSALHCCNRAARFTEECWGRCWRFWCIRGRGGGRFCRCSIFRPGPLPLAHAIGRLGCFAAGCCFGKPTALPWGVTFTDPEAARLAGTPLGVPLHPTQLYEAAAEFLNFLLLVWLGGRQRFGGEILGTYFILYGTERGRDRIFSRRSGAHLDVSRYGIAYAGG